VDGVVGGIEIQPPDGVINRLVGSFVVGLSVRHAVYLSVRLDVGTMDGLPVQLGYVMAYGTHNQPVARLMGCPKVGP